MSAEFNELLNQVRSCKICQPHLPWPVRPVIKASPGVKLIIIGQAPGRIVHETGLPWNDKSGDTLRRWLNLTREEFYDESRIALTPMGFCYPGTGSSGDLPPRPECAPTWHPPLFSRMTEVKLTLLVGSYSQNYYIKDKKRTLTDKVRQYADYLPEFIPMPHPSPRNYMWQKRNPWFEAEVVPIIRQMVHQILSD